jgi:hypothetical protein
VPGYAGNAADHLERPPAARPGAARAEPRGAGEALGVAEHVARCRDRGVVHVAGRIERLGTMRRPLLGLGVPLDAGIVACHGREPGRDIDDHLGSAAA